MAAIGIGIGIKYQHDDGAGHEVVKRLAELGVPGVLLAATDGEPSRLIDLWAEADVAVLVDAVRNEPSYPGKTHRFIIDLPIIGPTDTAISHGYSAISSAAARAACC